MNADRSLTDMPAVGVIGYGLMGQRHARVFAESGLCRLVAVADMRPEARKSAFERYGVDVYAEPGDLLSRGDISAVSICLPDSQHFTAMLWAMEAGKHILVEKPLATDVSEAAEILDLARRRKVKVLVGHLLRFDPRYWAIHERIEDGSLGEIIYMSAIRSSPVSGPLRYNGAASLEFHVAVHDIDLMLWYSGQRVVEVYAVGVSRLLKHLGIMDAVLTTLKFENGLVASLESSWVLPTTYPATLDARIRVVGTGGAASVETQDQGVLVVNQKGSILPDTMRWTEVNGRAFGLLREEILHFIRCVRGQDKPLVGPEQAYETVKVASAIRRSLELGGPVKLSE